MNKSELIGNVEITYDTNNYSKDKYIKQYRKGYMVMSIILIIGILASVALSMYLEYMKCATFVSIIVMVIGTLASMIASVMYIASTENPKTKLWDTLNWMLACNNIQAGYFNGIVVFIVGDKAHSLTKVLNSTKIEYTVDDTQVKDKTQDIIVEINFTNEDKTVVKVSNKK